MLRFVHKTKMVKQKPKNFRSFFVWRAWNHSYRCSLNSIIWCNLPWHFSQFLSLTLSKSANSFIVKSELIGHPLPHRKFFVRTPEFGLSPRGSNLRFSLKIRAGPEWQKRNDTGRKSSNIASVFLSDLIWYVYCFNYNTDKISFLNCQKLYDSFAAFMQNGWNICVEN